MVSVNADTFSVVTKTDSEKVSVRFPLLRSNSADTISGEVLSSKTVAASSALDSLISLTVLLLLSTIANELIDK